MIVFVGYLLLLFAFWLGAVGALYFLQSVFIYLSYYLKGRISQISSSIMSLRALIHAATAVAVILLVQGAFYFWSLA